MSASAETFTREELIGVMRQGYDDLIDFALTEPFKRVCRELNSLPDDERYNFVKCVLLSPSEIKRRGVEVPEGILIQRSSFGDRRPTLFCIKKYLPKRFHRAWENVNLTFDAVYADEDVSRDPEVCWRNPIEPEIQSKLLAEGKPLESAEVSMLVRAGFMGEASSV
jgi:hypothetical protein